MKLVLVLMPLLAVTAYADGKLGDDLRISSAVLGYDLQYRVYVPGEVNDDDQLPVVFVADGPWYIKPLNMPQVLDRLIGGGKIEPVIAVFVDARDPDNLNVNRRNEQFYCNVDYLRFYVDELIPAIEASYPATRSREERGIIGLSFGGLNAACFGLLGYEAFGLIGMHSPATHPIRTLLPAYEKSPKLPLRIFLSTGWPNDNTAKNRSFFRILDSKGYDVEFIQVREGHTWRNWKPLIDDVLLFFFAEQRADDTAQVAND